MKRVILGLGASAALILAGCGGSTDTGQLVGVRERPAWQMTDPYGMVFIPQGSYNMGPSDQDVFYAQVSQSKTVSIPAFYMDDTEITNNEYRQFVYWVKDSLAHTILGHFLAADEDAEETSEGTKIIDWKQKIKWDGKGGEEESEEGSGSLEDLFYKQDERYYGRKELDTRKLNYKYERVKYKQASMDMAQSKRPGAKPLDNRKKYVEQITVNIFPDTLAWLHDYTYAYNEPLSSSYFWHPAYDEYPVVGVSWKQANAFCSWRTKIFTEYFFVRGMAFLNDFRLPTEAEWEFAARGGLQLSPYPWGGPYIRNFKGCFLGNFKPMRGNYIDDGGLYTVKVTSYWPNDYGLYCMSGNVAEWTGDTYDESGYNFIGDLHPYYNYEAKNDDAPVLKRKVIRGGSWKDIGYYMQTATRSYDYQDSAKCHIGFRCVISFSGRDKSDL